MSSGTITFPSSGQMGPKGEPVSFVIIHLFEKNANVVMLHTNE